MNPNATTGSIRGFNSIDLNQGQTREALAPTNFSLTDLTRRINEIREKYDPDFLNSLIVTVLSHVQNLNNPHAVTLSETGANVIELVYEAWLAAGNTGTLQDFYVTFFQVSDVTISAGSGALTGSPTSLITVSGVDAIIEQHNTDPSAHTDLLNTILPGTPPGALPTTAYDAQFGTPIGTTCARASSIFVADRNGNLKEFTANTVAVDYSTGVGAYPLYGARTNLIFPSDPNLQSLGNIMFASNTLSPSGTLKVAPDGRPAMILAEDSNNAIHGYEVAVSITEGVEYTDSVYVYPLTTTGGITLYLDVYPDIAILLNLEDYSVTTASDSVIGYAQPYPNGWVRLGLQYVAPATNTVNFVTARTQTAVGTAAAYQGVSETQMFGIFGLQHTEGCGLATYIPTVGAVSTLAASELTIETTLGNASSGLLAITYTVPFTTEGTTRNLVSIEPGLSITITDTEITATTENLDSTSSVVSVTELFNRFVTTAFSYSPTGYILCSTGSSKVTEAGTPIDLTTGSITIILGGLGATALDGMVSALVLYPVADTSEIIEYLVGDV